MPLHQTPGAAGTAAFKHSGSLVHLRQGCLVASPRVRKLVPPVSTASSERVPATSLTAPRRVHSAVPGTILSTSGAVAPQVLEVCALRRSMSLVDVTGLNVPRPAFACGGIGAQPPVVGPAARTAQPENTEAFIAANGVVPAGTGSQGDDVRGCWGSTTSSTNQELQLRVSALRGVLAVWPSAEMRCLIKEAFESVDRCRLAHNSVWNGNEVRRFGLRILAAHGIDPAMVPWTAAVWHGIYCGLGTGGLTSNPPNCDLGIAERLARRILERLVAELEFQLAIARTASSREGAAPTMMRRRTFSCHAPVLVPSASPGCRAQACEPSTLGSGCASSSCSPRYRSKAMPPAVPAKLSMGCDPMAHVERSPGTGAPQTDLVAGPMSARASPVGEENLGSPSPGPMMVLPSTVTTVDRLTPTLGSPRSIPSLGSPRSIPSSSVAGTAAAPVSALALAPEGSLSVSAAKGTTGSAALLGVADRISVDKEFARLRKDLAQERAQRHALAMRVEALSRGCSIDARAAMPVSPTADNTTGSTTPARDQEDAKVRQRSPSFSTSCGKGVFLSAVPVHGADGLDSTSEVNGHANSSMQTLVDGENAFPDGSVSSVAGVVCDRGLSEKGTPANMSTRDTAPDAEPFRYQRQSFSSGLDSLTESSPLSHVSESWESVVNVQAGPHRRHDRGVAMCGVGENCAPPKAAQHIQRLADVASPSITVVAPDLTVPKRGELAPNAEPPPVASRDLMLVDARAILDELEHDLAAPTAEGDPAVSPPHSAPIDSPASNGACTMGTAPIGAGDGRALASTDTKGGAPHVLSFYRRKCLELASQVHRRENEVGRLRRALNEARNASTSSPI